MAYSHQRLRKTLAIVRVLVGALLVIAGSYKLFSTEFSTIEFPHAVFNYLNGQAVSFYPTAALTLVWRHASSFAVTMGLIEIVLGVLIFVGFAVRPVALLGMLYEFNFVLVSWHQSDAFSTDVDAASQRLMLIFLLALFAIGHAGETWGIGSIYHAGRARLWRSDTARPELVRRPPPVLDEEEPPADVADSEELPDDEGVRQNLS